MELYVVPEGLDALLEDDCEVVPVDGFGLLLDVFVFEEPPPRSTLVLLLLPLPPELLFLSCPLKSSSVLPTPDVFASVSFLLSVELLPPRLENV